MTCTGYRRRQASAPAAPTANAYAPTSAGRYACWPWEAKCVPTATKAASPAASVMSAMRFRLVTAATLPLPCETTMEAQ